jgi:predicted enzyme related to lactoylglutathione lyase
MGKVRAIGGVFFRCKDPESQRHWYQQHLGLNTDQYGTNFAWRHADAPDQFGYSQWSPFKSDTTYFEGDYLINYRVDDLDSLLQSLKAAGVEVLGEVTEEDYGKFVHIRDPEGQRVELWEPIDAEYEKLLEGITN